MGVLTDTWGAFRGAKRPGMNKVCLSILEYILLVEVTCCVSVISDFVQFSI